MPERTRTMLGSEALARKNSRELVQKLIEEDRVKSEGIKADPQQKHPVRRSATRAWIQATDQSKRSMQRELASAAQNQLL